MPVSRRRAIRLGIELTAVILAVGAPVRIGLGGLRLSLADFEEPEAPGG